MTAQTYDAERKLERIELALFGNGVNGIVDRLETIEQAILESKLMVAEIKDIKVWKLGWQDVTNYDDYRALRAQLAEQRILLKGLVVEKHTLQYSGKYVVGVILALMSIVIAYLALVHK